MAGIMAVALDVMDRPWKWGEADCCTAACDVFLRLHGIDLWAPHRGRYSTELGAARVIRSCGGFLPMIEAQAARAGLSASEGAPGDIGISAHGKGGASLVICVAPGQWVGKTVTGMATVQSVVRAWHHA